MSLADNPLFLNTVLLGGSPEQKLEAIARAGFQGAEIWRQDVEAHGGGGHAMGKRLTEQGVRAVDYQVLLDFDGAPDNRRAERRQMALAMLDTARDMGATTLLAPASTDPQCAADRVAEDLAWLCDKAAQRGLRIAWEAMAWSTWFHRYDRAVDLINRLNLPNLGLVVDAFHLFARQDTPQALDNLATENIYLVQYSDCAVIPSPEQRVDIARHHRLLPGAGLFPLATLTRWLSARGYRGPVGLEVFNDTLHKQPPLQVAQKAMDALTAHLVDAR